MKLKNVLIVVRDLERSKKFYKELFGLDVILDNDGNVMLTEGLVLQEAGLWETCIGREIVPKNNAAALYFEERDMEGFLRRLESWGEPVQYVTRPATDPLGRKTARFYDPDGNLIEVGTPG